MSDDPARSKEETRETQLLVIWERAIQTQMHFAELSIKTRQVGLTVVGATLGLAIVLNRTNSTYVLGFGCLDIPVTSVLCWAAAVVLFAIRLLDVGVYHRMLRGSVAFNEELEQKHLKTIFGTEKGLTEAISFFSRHARAKFSEGIYSPPPDTKTRYAGDRISHFYIVMIGTLVLAGMALMVAEIR